VQSDGSDLFMGPPKWGGVAVTIVVESCQPGSNPGDVLTCTASFGGLAEAGTLSSFHLVWVAGWRTAVAETCDR
jgi:hypothetical protein